MTFTFYIYSFGTHFLSKVIHSAFTVPAIYLICLFVFLEIKPTNFAELEKHSFNK